MKQKLSIIFILLSICFVQQGVMTTNLQYNYSFTQDKQDQQYLFSIIFTGNLLVYKANMSVDETVYILQKGMENNTFYTYILTTILNKNVEISVASSQGSMIIPIKVQNFTKIQQENNASIMSLANDLLNGVEFFIIIVLIAKYVLFYTPKEQK